MPTRPLGATSSDELGIAAVRCDERSLTAELSDGRQVSVPLDWYPRLANAAPDQRRNWKLVGGGYGVHWPELDEDISLEMLLRGLPSLESKTSATGTRS